MTAAPRVTHRGWAQQARNGLTEQQARAVIATVAIGLGSTIGALIYGQAAVNVVLAVGILWTFWSNAAMWTRTDETSDDTDQARADAANAKAQAVQAVNAAAECLAHHAPDTSSGRHSARKETTWT